MPDRTDDRFLYWPIMTAVGCPFLFVMGWSGIFGVPVISATLVLFSWAMSVLVALLMCVVSVVARAWRRLLSTAILPVTGFAAALHFAFVWDAGRLAGDYIHFFFMYPS